MSNTNFLNGAQFYVSIDNKGLWPNLTKLQDGTVGAMIYNHPSHGYGDGSNVELHVTEDQGESWAYRSTVTELPDEEPDAIRMNHNFGINSKGELISFVSGYHAGQKRPFLPIQKCVSTDMGKTWKRKIVDINPNHIPFGDIIRLDNGELMGCFSHLTRTDPKIKEGEVIIYSSTDDGVTWKRKSSLPDGNETNLLMCSNGDMLAISRSPCHNMMDRALPHGRGSILYRSKDKGKTWDEGKFISPQGQENAHMIETQSGKIIVYFTSRIPGLFGVVYRISEDFGETWGNFGILVSVPALDWQLTDVGYPSSVQFENGKIITCFYYGPKKTDRKNAATLYHQRYFMGTAVYTEEDLTRNVK
jgi:hypothetical protein